MERDWIKVFSHKDLLQVKLAEDILKQHGIESNIIRQPDSVFQPLGEADLYVRNEKAEAGLKVLKENDFL